MAAFASAAAAAAGWGAQAGRHAADERTGRARALHAVRPVSRELAVVAGGNGDRAAGGPARGGGRRQRVVVAWVGRGGCVNDAVVCQTASSLAISLGASLRIVRCGGTEPNSIPTPHLSTHEEVVARFCRAVNAAFLVYGGSTPPPLLARHLFSHISSRWIPDAPVDPSRASPVRIAAVTKAAADPAGAVGSVLAAALISENIGNDVRVDYQQGADGRLRGGKPEDRRSLGEKLGDALQGIYLPAGYPRSVTADYLAFTKWRVLQNLASSIMAVVSTEALLFGLGLGKATAATAAATAWVLKDGLGYIGKVAYGYAVGKQFDHDPKSWRVVSDTVEDIGGVLEILTPVFPGNFLLLASLANTLKGMAAMTGTATRHAIYKSLALQENQGDIATKGESQGVTCKMLGLGLGIAVSNAIGQNYGRLLSAYSGFAVVHLAANWKSMQCVQFATLNRQRAALVMEAFLRGDELPDPYDVSHRERMILTPWRGFQPNIRIGCPVSAAVDTEQELKAALRGYRDENFFMSSGSKGGNRADPGRRAHEPVFVVLRSEASARDVLKAFYTAQIYLSGQLGDLLEAKRKADRTFGEFLKAAKGAGWSTEHALLNPGRVRASW